MYSLDGGLHEEGPVFLLTRRVLEGCSTMLEEIIDEIRDCLVSRVRYLWSFERLIVSHC